MALWSLPPCCGSNTASVITATMALQSLPEWPCGHCHDAVTQSQWLCGHCQPQPLAPLAATRFEQWPFAPRNCGLLLLKPQPLSARHF
eukprot:1159010-Pelagomonas_calceolata.AAC.10